MADSLVDTAGINIHLSFTATPYYNNYSGVYYALQALSIRHVRDLMSDLGTSRDNWYYQRHSNLANLGISTIYTTSDTDTMSLALAYPGLVDDFEGYEGLNEYDNSGKTDWSTTVVAYQKLLYTTIKNNSHTTKYPVLGPSYMHADSWTQTSSAKAYMDYGNLHNYYSGANPGSLNEGSISGWVTDLQAGWGTTLPIITTETGYIYATDQFMHIVNNVGGTYLPRSILEQYLKGIKRTYLYELLDTDSVQYGLMNSDFTPKPAYTALANFLNLLSDPGDSFTPASLDYTLSGSTDNLHHLLMQKRDGSFWLALWLEVKVYDQVNQQYISIPDQTVKITLNSGSSSATVYEISSTGNIGTSSLASASSFNLTVTPNVKIVQLTTAGYSLNTSVTPVSSGIIALSPQASNGVYTAGQQITMNAIPSNGYTFTSYSGDITGTTAQQTLQMTANRNVVANFACNYSVSSSTTTLPATAGSVTVSVTTGAGCSWSVNSNTTWFSSSTTQVGSGSIILSYSANSGATRNATISVGGQSIPLTQASSAKKEQTISFNVLPTVTYGSGPVTLSASASSNLPVSYTVSGPATVSGNILSITGSGSVTITAEQSGDTTYNAAPGVSHVFTVSKAQLTIQIANASRETGKQNPTFSYTITGFLNGDSASIVTGAPVLSSTATISSPVGTYPITASIGALTASNYSFIVVAGTLTVTAATQQSQSITFPALPSSTYGAGQVVLKAEATSGLSVTYTVSGPAAVNGTSLLLTGAGTVTVTASQSGNSMYTAATPVTRSFTVAKAVLTVHANNNLRQENTANPEFTYLISGYVNGEDVTAINGTPLLATTALANSPVGSYPITVNLSGVSAANYTVIGIDGVLTVTPAALLAQSISFPAIADLTYGIISIPLSATSSSGLPVSYTVTGPATVSGTSLFINGAGLIVITASQSGNSSYAAASSATQSLIVNKAQIIFTANNLTRPVDTVNPTLTYNTSNTLVNGDTLSVISGTVSLSTTATVSSPPDQYPITMDCSSIRAANYVLRCKDGMLTITTGESTISPASSQEFIMSVPSSEQNISWGGTASFDIVLTPSNGPVSISLNTSTPPAGFTTRFSSSLVQVTSPTTVHLTVNAQNATAALVISGSSGAFFATTILPILCFSKRHLKLRTLKLQVGALLLVGVVLGLTGCGIQLNNVTRDIVVTAYSGSVQRTKVVHLVMKSQ